MPMSAGPPGGGRAQADLAGDRAAERQAGPVEDERLASPKLGSGPAADPHHGRVGGLRTPHEQHLHWAVFYVVALEADLLTGLASACCLAGLVLEVGV